MLMKFGRCRGRRPCQRDEEGESQKDAECHEQDALLQSGQSIPPLKQRTNAKLNTNNKNIVPNKFSPPLTFITAKLRVTLASY